MKQASKSAKRNNHSRKIGIHVREEEKEVFSSKSPEQKSDQVRKKFAVRL